VRRPFGGRRRRLRIEPVLPSPMAPEFWISPASTYSRQFRRNGLTIVEDHVREVEVEANDRFGSQSNYSWPVFLFDRPTIVEDLNLSRPVLKEMRNKFLLS
jgi:hypothetical protein